MKVKDLIILLKEMPSNIDVTLYNEHNPIKPHRIVEVERRFSTTISKEVVILRP